MSKFPPCHNRAGDEAPDQNLSPVTFLLFPLAKPIQSLHPAPSSSALSCTCDSQQRWKRCFAQLSFVAQQQKTEEHGDTQSPQQALWVAHLHSGITTTHWCQHSMEIPLEKTSTPPRADRTSYKAQPQLTPSKCSSMALPPGTSQIPKPLRRNTLSHCCYPTVAFFYPCCALPFFVEKL